MSQQQPQQPVPYVVKSNARRHIGMWLLMIVCVVFTVVAVIPPLDWLYTPLTLLLSGSGAVVIGANIFISTTALRVDGDGIHYAKEPVPWAQVGAVVVEPNGAFGWTDRHQPLDGCELEWPPTTLGDALDSTRRSHSTNVRVDVQRLAEAMAGSEVPIFVVPRGVSSERRRDAQRAN